SEREADERADFFAARFSDILSDEYGLPAGEELTFRLGIAVQIGDALITQAFAVDPAGDERVLAEALAVVRSYLTGYYDGQPSAE
ncbi:MAG: hypothetical protein ABI310_03860, partial [Microbacteriaceae bacterium]